MNEYCIVFDLDDTLYKEIEFVKSGYRYITTQLALKGLYSPDSFEILFNAFREKKNAFEALNIRKGFSITIPQYLEWYRHHFPDIKLSEDTEEVIKNLKSRGCKLGLITDGRTVTQRNKIKALGLLKYIEEEDIIISEDFGSEKPNLANYRYFMDKYNSKFVYVGDNISKDFVAANALGWLSIGLIDNGENIHPQKYIETQKAPRIWIHKLNELLKIIK